MVCMVKRGEAGERLYVPGARESVLMESNPQPSCSVESGLKSGGCERVESGVYLGDSVRMGKGTDEEVNFKVETTGLF